MTGRPGRAVPLHAILIGFALASPAWAYLAGLAAGWWH